MNYAEIRRKATTVDPLPAPPVSEMSPDEGFTESPVGKPEAPNDTGFSVAVI